MEFESLQGHLTSAAVSDFSAAVLLGDPTFYGTEWVDWSGDGTQNGELAVLRTKGSDENFSRSPYPLISFCYPHDAVCQNDNSKKNKGVHESYKNAATVSRELSFFHKFL